MDILNELKASSFICILAGVMFLIFRKKLSRSENLIFAIILLNIISDVIAAKLGSQRIKTGIIYNTLAPIERILTLYIYARCSIITKNKNLNFIGIIFIIMASITSQFMAPNYIDFQAVPFVLSGLVVALLSYFHLRNMVLDKAKSSKLVLIFTIANLMYYTLMASAMSAFTTSLKISDEFANSVYAINLTAYSLWSIMLILGLLWSKNRI